MRQPLCLLVEHDERLTFFDDVRREFRGVAGADVQDLPIGAGIGRDEHVRPGDILDVDATIEAKIDDGSCDPLIMHQVFVSTNDGDPEKSALRRRISDRTGVSVGRIAVGHPVDVTSDAYPGRTFKGRIAEIAQLASGVQPRP